LCVTLARFVKISKMRYLCKDLCLLNSLLNSLIAETETLMGLEMYNLIVLQTEGRKGPHLSKSVKMRGYDVYSLPSIACHFYSFMVPL